jgi:hypothetical protein
MNDFRYALRTFRNQPAFFAITVTLLALGVGSTAVIFSAFDALLFRNLPFANRTAFSKSPKPSFSSGSAAK